MAAEAATSCSVADPAWDLTVGGQKEVESRRDWDQTGLNRNGQEPATKQVQQEHLGNGQSDIFKEMGFGTFSTLKRK